MSQNLPNALPTPSVPNPKLSRYGLIALLSAGTLVLAGCGAQVSSELELSDDLSGTRTIVAAIADEDIQELSGGLEATEAALESHLPDELGFEGIAEAGSTEETEDQADQTDTSDGYQAVFTLEFSDLDDYASQAQALLDLADEREQEIRDSSEGAVEPRVARVDFVESDGPLLDGLVFEESFTGADLLDWTGYALLDEGVVTEDNAREVIGGTGDEGRITINDEEYETGEPFELNEGTDRRFDDVSVRITDQGTQVELLANLVSGDHDTGIELAEQHLDDAGVGEVEHDAGYFTVTLDEAEPLQNQLQTLLGAEGLQIDVEETANVEDSSLITTLHGTGFSCAAVCRDQPTISVDGYGELTPVEEETEGDTFTVAYERNVPVDEVGIDTAVTLTGSISQTYRFSVPAQAAEAFGEDLQAVFAPPEGTGTIETETTDDAVIYTAELEAAEPAEFNSILDDYLPGSSVYVTGLEGFTVWPSYTVEVSSFGAESFGEVSSQTVSLPAMHSVDAEASNGLDEELNSQQSAYVLAASGPTLSGMLLVGGLIVLGMIIGILVLVFRKRIASGLRSAQEQAQTMAHTANTSWQAAGQQQQTANAAGTDQPVATDVPTGPVDDATWQAAFHEHRMH